MRKILAAIFLALSVLSASAQGPPPAVPGLPDSERRTTYSISGTTCACAVNFAIYGDGSDYQSWVEVFLNGTRVNFNDATFGWTITSPTGTLANIARPITDGVLTFNNVQTGTVQIVGARRPRRTTQFTENRGVAARDLNQALTDIIAQNRETWDKTNDISGRAILGLPGETLNLLPPATTRANQFLTFDNTGSPTVTNPSVGFGNVVGPISSINGDLACWNGVTGSALRDCGTVGTTTLTGDITGSGVGTIVTTLATVNGNVGSFGSATQCLSITVNAKGLVTAASVATCTPAFSSLTGQATLAQLPTINASTVLANNSGGATTPSAIGPSSVLDMIGSTQGMILYRDAAAWLPLSPGTSGQLLTSNGAGANPAWTTASGTGTVTSVASDGSIKTSIASNGPITASGTLSLWGGPGDITNCTLVGTVSGNALTVALKNQAGADPSAASPCIIAFRNATIATGDYTFLQVTAATSFVTATSGSTFGAINSVPFRLWITAWNNAGTVVLGVSKQSTSTQVFPLNESNVQSSTACNACGTATSSGVFYTTAAQTNKAIRILGYMDWSTGLATAGTWASGPTTIQLIGPGIKKPGDIVQGPIVASSTATAQSTTTTKVQANPSVAISPTSTINLIHVSVMGSAFNQVNAGVGCMAQISRGTSFTALTTAGIGANGNGTGNTLPVSIMGLDAPATTSSITYVPFIYGSGSGTCNWNFVVNSITPQSFIEVWEIQG